MTLNSLFFRPEVVLLFTLVTAAAFFGRVPALSADVQAEKIVGNLQMPSGVAVRPEGGGPVDEVFVADRGAGRIVNLSNRTPDPATNVITGFAEVTTDAATRGVPGIDALTFLDRTRLVVAGSESDGQPFVRLYELAESDSPQTAADHKQDVELPVAADSKASRIRLHGFARTQPNDRVPDMLILSAAGQNEGEGLWKIAVRANTLGEAGPLAENNSANLRSVTAVAVGTEGYIVAASAGNSDAERSLKFVSPLDGAIALEISIELRHIVALVYSPKTGNLYAANHAPADNKGGIYRIDDASQRGKPVCDAVKITSLDRPTAFAFNSDGTLYVTTLGKTTNAANGELFKLSGGL